MDTRILVDTSTIIDFLRQKDKQKTGFYSLDKDHSIAISILTHTELYAGKSVWESPHRKAEIAEIIRCASVIPINESISILAGKIKSTNRLSLPDAMIASTALTYKMPLATLNPKDFESVEGLILHYQ